MKKLAALAVLVLCGLTGLGAAQVSATGGEKLTDAIAKLKGSGGAISFPCGNFEADSTINIAVDGVWLRGSGYCSRIHVTTNKDVFNVTAAFFAVEGFEIVIDSAQDRAGSNFVHSAGSQGRLEHLRFTGSTKIVNNGRVYYSDSQQGGLWNFFDIRFTGGATWQAFIALSSSTDKTIASTRVFSVIGPPSFSDAAFDLNGAIDTFQVSNIDLPLRHGHVFWLHNTVGSPINPRLVFCQANCSIETRGTTDVQLDASRDFLYHGFIAGGDQAVFVGANAADTELSNVVFMNLMKGAITIAPGAMNTMVKDSFFEDTTNLANNQYNTITVEPGASNFQIAGNAWRSTNKYKAHYAIALSPGNTSNYAVTNNLIPSDTFAAGAASMGATGPGFVVSGNTGIPSKSDVK